MNTTPKRKIFALLNCVCCLGAMQQAAKSQWVSIGHSDNYQSSTDQLRVLDQSLRILERSEPLTDLRAALHKGDTRFVGYNGFSFVAPGVPDAQLNRSTRFKTLKGSSDVLTTNLAKRIAKVARIYMKPYNQSLLRHLASKKRGSKK